MAIDVWASRRYGNMGGVLQITLIPRLHITEDSTENFSYTNELNIFFTHQTAQHNEQQKTSEIGTLEQKEISFIIPKFRQEVLDYFNANAQYYVLLVKDANGITRKVGTKKRPLRLAYNTETGRQYNDRNQIQVSIEGTHKQKSNEYIPRYRIITPTPSSLAFGSILQGNSTTQTFEIQNTGNATLQITDIVPPSASYSVDWSEGFILAGESQTITVTFAPASAGIFDGNITIESNATSGTDTIALTATGIAISRIISISPTLLAFGTVQAGSSVTRTFVISNTGNSTLTVSSINLPAGGYTADWTSGTIASGASRTITVTFAPTTNGAQDGTITVVSDKTSGSNTVSVTGATFEIKSVFSDGLNDTATIGSASNFNFERTDSFSIVFIVRTNRTGAFEMVVGKWDAGLGRGWYIANRDDSIKGIQFQLANTAGSAANRMAVYTGTALLANTYYHVAVTYNGNSNASGAKIYINKIDTPTTVQGNNLVSTTTTTETPKILGNIAGLYGNISLADLKIFSGIALTQTEVEQLFDTYGETVPSSLVPFLTYDNRFDTLVNTNEIDAIEGANAVPSGYTTNAKYIVDVNNNNLITFP